MKNILIVRAGVNTEEDCGKAIKDILQPELPQLVVMVIFGENESIETTFEVVNLF